MPTSAGRTTSCPAFRSSPASSGLARSSSKYNLIGRAAEPSPGLSAIWACLCSLDRSCRWPPSELLRPHAGKRSCTPNFSVQTGVQSAGPPPPHLAYENRRWGQSADANMSVVPRGVLLAAAALLAVPLAFQVSDRAGATDENGPGT